MAARKTERQMNLVILLLSARRYLSREQIRDSVDGYAGLSHDAFQRSFERDKDELRKLGVPIEVGSNEALFDDEIGYRIRRTDFELPGVDFTTEERIVLGLASQVFAGVAVGAQARVALGKLRAAGIEPETQRLEALVPTQMTTEPTLGPVWEAVLRRQPIRFDYREPGQTRQLEPWAVYHRRGSWYVSGRDVARDEPRMFKLARIVGAVAVAGSPGAYDLPVREVVERLAESLEPPLTGFHAIVAIRGEAAPTLRRRGEQISHPSPAGYVPYSVPYARTDELAAEAAAAGPDALVLEPPEAREAVLARLRAVAARGEG